MSKNGFSNIAKELKGFVRPLAKDALKKRGFSEYRLLTEWPEIVGLHLSAVSCPQKISFEMNKKTDGVLHVDVLSVSALEFQHLQPIILERIAAYFGYKAIARIVLHQTSKLSNAPRTKAKEPLPPGITVDTKPLENCDDPELKAQLESLAAALNKNN